RPSLRSMAGMSSMMLWIPINKIPVQAQAVAGAFLGMELYCKNVSRCDCAGKAQAVMAYPNSQGGIVGHGVVAVHEVEVRAVGDAVPQGVRPDLARRAPAHVRHLQQFGAARLRAGPGELRPRKAPDRARKDVQAGHIAFFAGAEQ